MAKEPAADNAAERAAVYESLAAEAERLARELGPDAGERLRDVALTWRAMALRATQQKQDGGA
jgi:hypothetical protein